MQLLWLHIDNLMKFSICLFFPIITSKSRIQLSDSLLVSTRNVEFHIILCKIILVWIIFDDIYLTCPIQVKSL